MKLAGSQNFQPGAVSCYPVGNSAIPAHGLLTSCWKNYVAHLRSSDHESTGICPSSRPTSYKNLYVTLQYSGRQGGAVRHHRDLL